MLKHIAFEASLPTSNLHTGRSTETPYEHKHNIHHSLRGRERERECSHLQCFIKFWVGAVTLDFGLALTLARLIRQKVCFDISADQAGNY